MIGEIVSSLADSAFDAAGTAVNTLLSTAQSWKYYKKQSKLDWEYYRDKYAPLNQQLQNEMFDYQTAGNLKAQGDLVGVKKNALLENGYNPILAINGGVSGSVSPGSTGSLGSPHSAHGISANTVPMKLGIMRNALEMDLARQQKVSLAESTALQKSKGALELGKLAAETERVKADTIRTLKDSELPGAVGQAVRSLQKTSELMGDWFRENWSSAKSYMSDLFNPVESFDKNRGKVFDAERGIYLSPRQDRYEQKAGRSIYK